MAFFCQKSCFCHFFCIFASRMTKRAFFILCVCFIAVTTVGAQRLRIRANNFTTRDGLASNVVNTAVQQQLVIPITDIVDGVYTVVLENATGYADGEFEKNNN